MTIREVEKLNIRLMENQKRKQERELASLETAHQNLKAELKKSHHADLVEIREQHHRDIDSENAKKEKVLEGMRNHLQHTERMTDKQLKQLRNTSEKSKADTQAKMMQDRDQLVAENELYLDELNHRFKQATKRAYEDGQSQVEQMNQKKRHEYAETHAFHQKKLNDTTNEFATRFQQETMKQKRLKDETDKQFKNERMQTNQRQQTELAKMTEQHQTFIEARDVNYRKGLKEQDEFFEKKYAVNLTNRNEELNRLDERHEKVMSKMKSELSRKIAGGVTRSEDPFYEFTELRPTMTRYPDRVEVAVEVPEYAKQDLRVTTNNKEVIISFNRRYADQNKTADGTVNRINKVESFTTRLLSDGILDPKSVKQSYEDGVMIYVIKKV